MLQFYPSVIGLTCLLQFLFSWFKYHLLLHIRSLFIFCAVNGSIFYAIVSTFDLVSDLGPFSSETYCYNFHNEGCYDIIMCAQDIKVQ